MNMVARIPSVNYHLWKPCNMACKFCFATFQDIGPSILPKGHLGRDDSLSVVESLAGAGFRKINFAGGEPTLCPWLPDLIKRAKELNFTTSMVTNGSRISAEWLNDVAESLDWTALSIDSVSQDTLSRIGRATRSGPMSAYDYLHIIDILRQHRIRVKINTVISRDNLHESLADFIIQARPERWKLLQVLPIQGQNDAEVDQCLITAAEFDRFVKANRRVEDYGISVVPESNDMMTGSYVMVDPAGRFFDNVAGVHTYSRPMLEAGVEEALREVSVDARKFLSRSGMYDW